MYSNVAKPDWTLDHTIDFNNAEIIDKGKDAGILAHSENRRGRQQLMPFTRTIQHSFEQTLVFTFVAFPFVANQT